MQDTTDGDNPVGFVPDEVDRVGKSFCGGETIGANSWAKELGRAGDLRELRFHTMEKVAPQAGLLLLIPEKCIPQVGLSLGSDNEPVGHVLRVMRALTSAHEEPSVGLAW